MMNNTPLVTAIIPVYNGEKVIERCVDSLLKQSYTNMEILIIDDGSKDSTAEILDRYEDSRIRVIHKPNSGVSDTRNMALKEAKGEYIQFLDADDYVTPDATMLFVNRAIQTDADLVISDFYRVVKNRVSHKGDIATDDVLTRQDYALYMLDKAADYYYGVLWNKFFKTEIIRKYDIHMDKEASFCEDFMFNLEYLRHCDRIAALRVPLYYYVKTEGSLVAKNFNVSSILNAKKTVFVHYKDFYKDVFDKEDYEEIQLQVYYFLIQFCRDEFTLPIISNKLGEERISLNTQLSSLEDPLTDIYLTRKTLAKNLEPIAIKYEIGIEGAVILMAISNGHDTRKELKELLSINTIKLEGYLSLLSYKLLIRETRDKLTVTDKFDLEMLEMLLREKKREEYESLGKEEITEYERIRSIVRTNLENAF